VPDRTGSTRTTSHTAGPVAAPPGPRERRLRAGHLALAVALIAVGALGTVALVTSVAADDEYVALGRDVHYGAQLQPEDLITVRMSTTPGLRPVAASDLDRVIGAYATMPLAAGTLLTPAQVTAAPAPGPGQHVVGITVRGDRLPAQRLRPGDPVLLVATADRHSSSDDTVGGRPQTWHATVTAVAGGDGGGFLGGGSGSVTLDVAVPAADGPTVATLAAANRLVIVLAGS
jgi:hypothetical protein